MRYPAGEKLEIIRLVEQSHLPVRRTLERFGIPRATFYRWYTVTPKELILGFRRGAWRDSLPAWLAWCSRRRIAPISCS